MSRSGLLRWPPRWRGESPAGRRGDPGLPTNRLWSRGPMRQRPAVVGIIPVGPPEIRPAGPRAVLSRGLDTASRGDHRFSPCGTNLADHAGLDRRTRGPRGSLGQPGLASPRDLPSPPDHPHEGPIAPSSSGPSQRCDLMAVRCRPSGAAKSISHDRPRPDEVLDRSAHRTGRPPA
jgi:hypothetical protein